MSTEEQYLAIGRISVERTEARRQIALLSRRIIDYGHVLYAAGVHLMPEQPQLSEMTKGCLLLKGQVGFEQLCSDVEEYRCLLQRERDLSASLRESGAE